MMDQSTGGLIGGLLRRSLGKSDDLRPNLVSVLDPGTEYVKALVVQLEGDRAVVVGQGMDRHSDMPFERGTRAVDLRLKRACDSALRRAEDMTESVTAQKLVPDHVVLSFPSHMVRQGAFTVQQRRSSPGREITVKELEQAFARAERLALQQLAGQLGTTRANLSLVGSAILDIKVNGRMVSDPLGFRGDTLSVTVFNALAQNQHIAIMERLAEHLELEVLYLVSEEHVLADCLPMQEAIAVNMGSVLTTLGWMQGGCPASMMVISYGGRHLTQRLASAFKLTTDQAEALKLRYCLSQLDDDAAQSVREELRPGIAEWLARVEAGLATVAGKRSLPPFIYVCGGGTDMPGLLEAARAFPWAQHLRFDRYPEIHVFGPGQIPGVFNRTGQVWGAGMTVAMALARWATRRKQADTPLEEMLGRVIRKNVAVYAGG